MPCLQRLCMSIGSLVPSPKRQHPLQRHGAGTSTSVWFPTFRVGSSLMVRNRRRPSSISDPQQTWSYCGSRVLSAHCHSRFSHLLEAKGHEASEVSDEIPRIPWKVGLIQDWCHHFLARTISSCFPPPQNYVKNFLHD